MLTYREKVQEELDRLGAEAYPYEGCGLLLGRTEGEVTCVEALYPVENRWGDEQEKRIRFRISSADMLQAELAAARDGLDVVGVFHSHPDHPPVASPRDLAWAAWTGYSYVITEIRDGRPVLSRSWQLKEDRSGFVEETIQVG